MAYAYQEDEEPLLHAHEENIPTNLNSSTTSTALDTSNRPRSDIAPDITLSPGKLFHLFVSHSGVDSDEIWSIVKSIEKRFGIRCLYADRDFQPGKDITDNIKEGIEKSMKILLVLSPSYIESGYCWFEQKVAFQMSITQRQNCLIPLILKPFTGPLPTALSNLTYIDACKESDVVERIFDAFVYKDDDILYPLFDPESENETFKSSQKARQQNGVVLMEIFASPEFQSCTGPAMEFKELTHSEKMQLTEDGIDITQEYEMLRKEVNMQRYLRYLLLRSSWKRRLFIGVIIITLIWLFSSILFFTFLLLGRIDLEFTIPAVFLMSLYIAIPVSVICCVLRSFYKDAKFKKGVNICWKHNLQFYRQKKCFILYDINSYQPKLVFIKYDITECKSYLRQFYKRRNPDLSETYYMESAESAVDGYMEKNNQRLVDWKNLPTSFMNRHNTFRQKACLCQLVLDEIMI